MPDENKTVDIDTSGPDIDVELETSTPETEVSIPEEKETVREASTSTQETSNEKQETKTEEGKEDQKDELEVYSKDVQRRIAKLTKKWREAERQKEEAITYARAQKQQADSISKRYSSLETNSLKDRESKLTAAIEGAKARLAQARDANDIGLEVDIQREIARLGYEESRLLELKSTREEMAKEEVIPTMDNLRIPTAPISSQPDEKAEGWASKNKWFGTDKAMTYTAFDLHKTLTDEEGYDPKSDEYYAEIDKRIRLEFPHKFGTNEDKAQNNTTKPTQIVASARRSVNPGRKTVRLTPSQVAIAKKLGVPLEEYAKQIKIMKEV
jgi:DNA repair exonuclease SbcCD ATPase subunit